MGLFDQKNEEAAYNLGKLEAENEQLKLRIIKYEAQIEQKDTQILSLQEGILAVQAPEAFAFKKDLEYAAEHDAANPDSHKHARAIAEQAEILQRYSQMQEGPIFRDGNDVHDMLSKFTQGAGAPEQASVHENDES